MSVTAADLVAGARSLRGVVWRHQGRSEWAVDCIGFVFMAAKRAGLDLVGATGVVIPKAYNRLANPDAQRLLCEHRCEKIASPVLGCVAFFQFPEDSLPRHFGIITDKGVIHAHARLRKVVEHGYRAQWVRWTHSLWKLPGVSYPA